MASLEIILSTYGIYIVGLLILSGIGICIYKLSIHSQRNVERINRRNEEINRRNEEITHNMRREIIEYQINIIEEYLDITQTLKNYLDNIKSKHSQTDDIIVIVSPNGDTIQLGEKL